MEGPCEWKEWTKQIGGWKNEGAHGKGKREGERGKGERNLKEGNNVYVGDLFQVLYNLYIVYESPH